MFQARTLLMIVTMTGSMALAAGEGPQIQLVARNSRGPVVAKTSASRAPASTPKSTGKAKKAAAKASPAKKNNAKIAKKTPVTKAIAQKSTSKNKRQIASVAPAAAPAQPEKRKLSESITGAPSRAPASVAPVATDGIPALPAANQNRGASAARNIGSIASVDANRSLEIRGQSRTLSMMLVLKNSKDNIDFIKVRKNYEPEIRATEF